jgi:hypothetical protein
LVATDRRRGIHGFAGYGHRSGIALTDADETRAMTFRCPPELESFLPRPIPAILGLPDWFKTMPANGFSKILQTEQMTLKKCPPFIDAMTRGFLILLATDIRIENGEFAWSFDLPAGAGASYARSPLDFHDDNQAVGTPSFGDDRFVVQFNNHWLLETPPGYSLLITHPVNRHDLPFVTLTRIVDTDRHRDDFINFPARWRDAAFNGTLTKGTPIAQCIPIKRNIWNARFETITGDAIGRLQATKLAVANEHGIYRRQFRAPKQ